MKTPLGALIVRIPQRRNMLEGMLRQIGHGESLAAGKIPDEYFAWRLSLDNDTETMRHERDMVKAIVRGQGFAPNVVLEDVEAAAVSQPVLMTWGTADDVGSVDVWETFVELMPQARLRVLEGAGHLPWLDFPDEVARLVRDFIT